MAFHCTDKVPVAVIGPPKMPGLVVAMLVTVPPPPLLVLPLAIAVMRPSVVTVRLVLV
jgi:hypothetical protein